MKTNDNVVGSIYSTMNYSKFKIIDGNRSIDKGRVAKIISSIQDMGFRTCPIVVNKNFEIIDGQGRFTALKDLGLPVQYVLDKDADIDVCRKLNINQKNWSLVDYIESYSELGNEDYSILSQFIHSYKQFSLTTILCVCGGCFSAEGQRSLSNIEKIKNGEWKFFGKEKDRMMEFEYLNKFVSAMKHIGGRIEFYYASILFAIRYTKVDMDRLVNKVNNLTSFLAKAPDMKTALTGLTEVYNRNAREDRVYIDHEYKIMVTDKCSRSYRG